MNPLIIGVPLCFGISLESLGVFIDTGRQLDAYLGVAGILLAGIQLGIAIRQLEERAAARRSAAAGASIAAAFAETSR